MNELNLYADPAAMFPLFPEGEGKQELAKLALELLEEDAKLQFSRPFAITSAVSKVVENMNTYYTNKIEGYDTHPLDIEKALNGNFSNKPEKKNLQLLAKAHLETAKKVLGIYNNKNDIYSFELLKKIHLSFYELLPEAFKFIETDSGNKIDVIPGKFRATEVGVQHHVGPKSDKIGDFAERFENEYSKNYKSKLDEIIKIAAAHHRFLFIHPFIDGNGRVARLFSDICFLNTIHSKFLNVFRLWSVSRGLARNRQEYYDRLHNADQKRINDYDGRGNLSNKYLIEFCEFFLKTAIDQIKFMQELLDINNLRQGMRSFCDLMVVRKHYPKEAFYLLDETLTKGYLEKKEMARLTGKSENTARKIVKQLVAEGFLIDSNKLAFEISFPAKYLPYLFPSLYPGNVEAEILRENERHTI